jgi:hypothetical protein
MPDSWSVDAALERHVRASPSLFLVMLDWHILSLGRPKDGMCRNSPSGANGRQNRTTGKPYF